MRSARKSTFTVISPPESPAAPAPECASARIRRLQAEARSLARGQIEELREMMTRLSVMASDIAEGGDAYPVGAREIASRLAEDLEAKAQTLQAVVTRT